MTSCVSERLSTSPEPRPTFTSTPPEKLATRWPVDRVVYLMLENRSFDNIFGRYPGANGTRTGMRTGTRTARARARKGNAARRRRSASTSGPRVRFLPKPYQPGDLLRLVDELTHPAAAP